MWNKRSLGRAFVATTAIVALAFLAAKAVEHYASSNPAARVTAQMRSAQ